MKVEQIYTGCLAEAAYYIESKGEAVVIDPMREIEPYLERAAADGATIKYVFETHFHADFVSGHLDLAKKQVPRLFMALRQYPVLRRILPLITSFSK
ncbi:MAG: MBL fold metallo-hydrolase [Saprospiraceae bacterium]